MGHMKEKRNWEWTRDRVETVAQCLHDEWWKYKSEEGFVLGPTRDSAKKTHPHLVPWTALSTEEQNQDRFIASQLLAKHFIEGRPVTPQSIHDAWCLWVACHDGCHPHLKPFSVAHARGPGEHEAQTRKIQELFDDWKAERE